MLLHSPSLLYFSELSFNSSINPGSSLVFRMCAALCRTNERAVAAIGSALRQPLEAILSDPRIVKVGSSPADFDLEQLDLSG